MSAEAPEASQNESTHAPVDLLELGNRYIRDGLRHELGAHQEVQLACIIADGEEAQEKLRLAQEVHLQLHPDTKADLEKKVSQATLATDIFIAANIGLVRKAAITVFYNSSHKVYLEDLDAVGRATLYRCVKEFDPSRGYKFSSYAYQSIEGQMRMWAIKQGRTITQSYTMIYKIKAYDKLVASGHTPEEAAAKVNSNIASIEEHRKAQQQPDAISYHSHISHGSDTELIEVIAAALDVTETEIGEQVVSKVAIEMLANGLKQWLKEQSEKWARQRSGEPDRNYKILLAAYGYGLPHPEVAEQFGVAPDRVRGIMKDTRKQVDKDLPPELRQLAKELGFI